MTPDTWTVPLQKEDPRLTNGMQDFFCPGCSRVIIRPPGSSTWCTCEQNIPAEAIVRPAHFMGMGWFYEKREDVLAVPGTPFWNWVWR